MGDGVMSEQSGKLSCTLWCFAIGGLAGALATVMLVILGDFGWNGAVFTGAVFALAVAAFLVLVICRSLPTMAEVQARSSALRPAPAAHVAPASELAPTPAPTPAPAPEPPLESAPAPVVAPVPDPAPAPGLVAAASAVKPVFLSAARDSGPDDLKLIRGVGPKLEQMLHGMGVFHFDQIAAWSAEEVAWVDDNLEGFKGRVTRDSWVPQARDLAAGTGA
jgi:predicted flap endonuclease-1-like 5' DNA nuclease